MTFQTTFTTKVADTDTEINRALAPEDPTRINVHFGIELSLDLVLSNCIYDLRVRSREIPFCIYPKPHLCAKMGNTETTDYSSGQQVTSATQPQPQPQPQPPPPAATVPLPPPPMAVNTVQVGTRDARGIERGRCTKCPNCVVYSPQPLYDEYGQTMISVSSKCVVCGCPPGAHENLSKIQAWSDTSQAMNPQSTMPVSGTTDVSGFVMIPDSTTPAPVVPNCLPTVFGVCAFPHCGQSVEFDPNTGSEFAYCSDHIHANAMAYATPATDLQVVDFQDAAYGHPVAQPVAADTNGWQQRKYAVGDLSRGGQTDSLKSNGFNNRLPIYTYT